ncbi:MAG: hypothetical protein G8D58_06145, partial [gamma proteobacterium symbiont of Phacoides pectinatus]
MKKRPAPEQNERPEQTTGGGADLPSLEEVEALLPGEVRSILHNLQVHQMELEMQNEELRYTQQVLSDSREKYSRLFESAPVGYCNLDQVCRYLVKDFGTSQSPKSTRQRDSRYCPD